MEILKKSPKISCLKRTTGSLLAGAFIFTQILFVHRPALAAYGSRSPRSAGKTIWDERRAAASSPAASPSPEQNLRLAQLPRPLPGLSDAVPKVDVLPGLARPGDGERSERLPSWLRGISPAHGEVQEVLLSDRPRGWVALIQDVHGQEEAQRNIAGIIDDLGAGVRGDGQTRPLLVGLEGAAGELDFAPYRRLADPDVLRRASDHLLRLGWIGGPQYAGLTAARPPAFFGAEEPGAYLANVDAFDRSRPLLASMEKWLRNGRRELDELKRIHFSPELLAMDAQRQGFHGQKSGLIDYVRILSSPAGTPGTDFPQTARFLEAHALEKELDLKIVERERDRLLRELTAVLSPADLQRLVDASLAYRAGSLSYGAYYGRLRDLCRAQGLPLAAYPAFDRYIRYLLLADGIDRKTLFQEILRLEEEKAERLLASPAQEQLWSLSRDMDLLDKMAHQNLSPEEWVQYRSRRETVARIPERLSRFGKTFAEHQNPIEPFEAFYTAAARRDRVMASRLAARASREKAPGTAALPPAVLVAGGFHTPGMARLLREQGLNVVVLAPRLSQIKDTHYMAVFAKERTPLDKILLGEKLFLVFGLSAGPARPFPGLKFREAFDKTHRYLVGLCAAGQAVKELSSLAGPISPGKIQAIAAGILSRVRSSGVRSRHDVGFTEIVPVRGRPGQWNVGLRFRLSPTQWSEELVLRLSTSEGTVKVISPDTDGERQIPVDQGDGMAAYARTERAERLLAWLLTIGTAGWRLLWDRAEVRVLATAGLRNVHMPVLTAAMAMQTPRSGGVSLPDRRAYRKAPAPEPYKENWLIRGLPNQGRDEGLFSLYPDLPAALLNQSPDRPIKILLAGAGRGRVMLDLLTDPKFSRLRFEFHSVNAEENLLYDLPSILQILKPNIFQVYQDLDDLMRNHTPQDGRLLERAISLFEALHRNHRVLNINRGENLNELDTDYDVVILGTYVIEYIEGQLPAIQGLYERARPGGQVFVDLYKAFIGPEARTMAPEIERALGPASVVRQREKSHRCSLLIKKAPDKPRLELPLRYSRSLPQKRRGAVMDIYLPAGEGAPSEAPDPFIYLQAPVPRLYAPEENIARGLDDLIKTYGPFLNKALDRLPENRPAKILLVGAGRSRAVLDLLRDPRYATKPMEFHVLNREKDLPYDLRHIMSHLKPDIFERYDGLGDFVRNYADTEEGLLAEALMLFDRLHAHSRVMDISRGAGLEGLEEDFDLIVMESNVMDYVRGQVEVTEALYSRLREGGELLMELGPYVMEGAENVELPGSALARIIQSGLEAEQASRRKDFGMGVQRYATLSVVRGSSRPSLNIPLEFTGVEGSDPYALDIYRSRSAEHPGAEDATAGTWGLTLGATWMLNRVFNQGFPSRYAWGRALGRFFGGPRGDLSDEEWKRVLDETAVRRVAPWFEPLVILGTSILLWTLFGHLGFQDRSQILLTVFSSNLIYAVSHFKGVYRIDPQTGALQFVRFADGMTWKGVQERARAWGRLSVMGLGFHNPFQLVLPFISVLGVGGTIALLVLGYAWAVYSHGGHNAAGLGRLRDRFRRRGWPLATAGEETQPEDVPLPSEPLILRQTEESKRLLQQKWAGADLESLDRLLLSDYAYPRLIWHILADSGLTFEGAYGTLSGEKLKRKPLPRLAAHEPLMRQLRNDYPAGDFPADRLAGIKKQIPTESEWVALMGEELYSFEAEGIGLARMLGNPHLSLQLARAPATWAVGFPELEGVYFVDKAALFLVESLNAYADSLKNASQSIQPGLRASSEAVILGRQILKSQNAVMHLYGLEALSGAIVNYVFYLMKSGDLQRAARHAADFKQLLMQNVRNQHADEADGEKARQNYYLLLFYGGVRVALFREDTATARQYLRELAEFTRRHPAHDQRPKISDLVALALHLKDRELAALLLRNIPKRQNEGADQDYIAKKIRVLEAYAKGNWEEGVRLTEAAQIPDLDLSLLYVDTRLALALKLDREGRSEEALRLRESILQDIENIMKWVDGIDFHTGPIETVLIRRLLLRMRAAARWNSPPQADADISEAGWLEPAGLKGDILWWQALLPSRSPEEMEAGILRYLAGAAETGTTYANCVYPLFSWGYLGDTQVQLIGEFLLDLLWEENGELTDRFRRAGAISEGADLRALAAGVKNAIPQMLSGRQNPAIVPEGADPRLGAAPLRRLMALLREPKLNASRIGTLVNILAEIGGPGSYIAFRAIGLDKRFGENGLRDVKQAAARALRALETSASTQSLRNDLQQIESAKRELRFADAVRLQEEIADRHSEVAEILADDTSRLRRMLEAWQAYQEGLDELCADILSGLQDRSATALQNRIDQIRRIENLRRADRLSDAIDAAVALAAPQDARAARLLEELQREEQAASSRRAEIEHRIELGRLEEAEALMAAFWGQRPEDESLMRLRWSLAQAYEARGRALWNPDKPLLVEDYKKARDLCEGLLAYSRLPSSPGASRGRKKPKGKDKGPSSRSEFHRDNVRRLHHACAARSALGPLELHLALLEKLVEAEAFKIFRLSPQSKRSYEKQELPALRWNYNQLDVWDRGLIHLNGIETPDSYGKTFRRGESFRIYDREGNLINTAQFQVDEVRDDGIVLKLAREDDKDAVDWADLPEIGQIERLPDNSTWTQWRFLKQVTSRLQETTEAAEQGKSGDAPTTGLVLVDQNLGLPLDIETGDIPFTQGPPGTGKTRLIKALLHHLFGLAPIDIDEKKTEALGSALRLLSDRPEGKPYKILILSQSHAAVDNVGLDLKDSVQFIRVGNEGSKVNKGLWNIWNNKRELLRQAPQRYARGENVVVLGTNNGFFTDHDVKNNPFFKEFDLVIMDESGRATVAETLLPLQWGKRVFFVGDHDQLPPFGIKREEIKMVFEELGTTDAKREELKRLFSITHLDHFKTSLFETQFTEPRPGFEHFRLNINRRSIPWLVKNVIRFFYPFIEPDPDKDPRPEPDTLVLRDIQADEEPAPEDSEHEGSWRNLAEAQTVLEEIDRVLNIKDGDEFRYSPRQITTISYYSYQVASIEAALRARAVLHEHLQGGVAMNVFTAKRLQRDLEKLAGAPYLNRIKSLLARATGGFDPQALRDLQNITPIPLTVPEGSRTLSVQDLEENVLVSTVDSFQGHQNDVIILSFVRSNNKQNIGFEANLQRLNVSLSRMKEKLVLIGDFSRTLTKARYIKRRVSTEDEAKREIERFEETEKARELFLHLFSLPQLLAMDCRASDLNHAAETIGLLLEQDETEQAVAQGQTVWELLRGADGIIGSSHERENVLRFVYNFVLALDRRGAAEQGIAVINALPGSLEDIFLATMLCRFYLRAGRPEEGLLLLEQAPLTHYGDIDFLSSLAQLYIQAGRDDEAVSLMESVWNDLGDDPAYAAALCDLYFDAGRPMEGLARFEGIWEKFRADPRFIASFARLHVRAGEFKLGRERIYRLKNLLRENGEARDALSELHAQESDYQLSQGDPDKALIHIRAARTALRVGDSRVAVVDRKRFHIGRLLGEEARSEPYDESTLPPLLEVRRGNETIQFTADALFHIISRHISRRSPSRFRTPLFPLGITSLTEKQLNAIQSPSDVYALRHHFQNLITLIEEGLREGVAFELEENPLWLSTTLIHYPSEGMQGRTGVTRLAISFRPGIGVVTAYPTVGPEIEILQPGGVPMPASRVRMTSEEEMFWNRNTGMPIRVEWRDVQPFLESEDIFYYHTRLIDRERLLWHLLLRAGYYGEGNGSERYYLDIKGGPYKKFCKPERLYMEVDSSSSRFKIYKDFPWAGDGKSEGGSVSGLAQTPATRTLWLELARKLPPYLARSVILEAVFTGVWELFRYFALFFLPFFVLKIALDLVLSGYGPYIILLFTAVLPPIRSLFIKNHGKTDPALRHVATILTVIYGAAGISLLLSSYALGLTLLLGGIAFHAALDRPKLLVRLLNEEATGRGLYNARFRLLRLVGDKSTLSSQQAEDFWVTRPGRWYPYLSLSTARSRAASDLIKEKLRPLIPENALIVDLMAGAESHLPDDAAPREVIGVDIDLVGLEQNRSITRRIQQDLNSHPRMDVADHSVDMVVMVSAIAYVPDPLSLLREVKRMLKPGGSFAIVFTRGFAKGKASALWRAARYMERPGLVKALLDEAGFEDITVDHEYYMDIFPAVSSLWFVSGRAPRERSSRADREPRSPSVLPTPRPMEAAGPPRSAHPPSAGTEDRKWRTVLPAPGVLAILRAVDETPAVQRSVPSGMTHLRLYPDRLAESPFAKMTVDPRRGMLPWTDVDRLVLLEIAPEEPGAIFSPRHNTCISCDIRARRGDRLVIGHAHIENPWEDERGRPGEAQKKLERVLDYLTDAGNGLSAIEVDLAVDREDPWGMADIDVLRKEIAGRKINVSIVIRQKNYADSLVTPGFSLIREYDSTDGFNDAIFRSVRGRGASPDKGDETPLAQTKETRGAWRSWGHLLFFAPSSERAPAREAFFTSLYELGRYWSLPIGSALAYLGIPGFHLMLLQAPLAGLALSAAIALSLPFLRRWFLRAHGARGQNRGVQSMATVLALLYGAAAVTLILSPSLVSLLSLMAGLMTHSLFDTRRIEIRNFKEKTLAELPSVDAELAYKAFPLLLPSVEQTAAEARADLSALEPQTVRIRPDGKVEGHARRLLSTGAGGDDAEEGAQGGVHREIRSLQAEIENILSRSAGSGKGGLESFQSAESRLAYLAARLLRLENQDIAPREIIGSVFLTLLALRRAKGLANPDRQRAEELLKAVGTGDVSAVRILLSLRTPEILDLSLLADPQASPAVIERRTQEWRTALSSGNGRPLLVIHSRGTAEEIQAALRRYNIPVLRPQVFFVDPRGYATDDGRIDAWRLSQTLFAGFGGLFGSPRRAEDIRYTIKTDDPERFINLELAEALLEIAGRLEVYSRELEAYRNSLAVIAFMA